MVEGAAQSVGLGAQLPRVQQFPFVSQPEVGKVRYGFVSGSHLFRFEAPMLFGQIGFSGVGVQKVTFFPPGGSIDASGLDGRATAG